MAENQIAENMLDVLDTIDEILSGADQRLMEKGAKSKEPKPLAGALEPLKKVTIEAATGKCSDVCGDMKICNPLPEASQNKNGEGYTNKPKHDESVKRSFKLPAWKAMMDEDTPPGSPFSRSLFADGHVEAKPVMELVPDHLVKNEKEVKSKAEPLEPRMTSTAAVKAMFEQFLGPSKTAETARTTLAAPEGKARQKAGNFAGEASKGQNVQDKVSMEGGGDPVLPVPPRIVRKRQQKQKEDGAQAAVVESKSTHSKSPLHVLRSRAACSNKRLAEIEARESPARRRREVSVPEFRKATPPMTTLKEESDYELDDYYHDFLHDGVKANPDKPAPLQPTMCSDDALHKARLWSVSSSAPALELADGSLFVEPNTSIPSIKTQSSDTSRNSSEETKADTSASSVPSDGPQSKKINPVAAMIPKAEFKVTGADRERYRPTGKLASLFAAHAAGVIFTETETLQGILQKGKQAVRDEAERASKRESTTSAESKEDTSMDDVKIEIEGVKPYSALRRNDPFITPKKNVFEKNEDGGSVYSRPSGFTSTHNSFRRMDSLEDKEDQDASIGSPRLGRTQQVRRNSRKTSVPSSAVGRYIAGPDASREEIIKTSPASTASLTTRGPKELRMIGLTMEELFLDPTTGDFIEPDRSIGGTAELRRKYEIEGREAWENGELSMEALQKVLKEREKERSLTESTFLESAKRMPPPKSKLPRGGKKSKFGMHRQHSNPTSIAATLFSLSRKASEPAGASLRSPKRRAATPSLASDEKDRSSGISAGMRRIFAGNFGPKSSDSVMTKRSIDKSMITVITSSTASGEIKPSSIVSVGSTRASGESVLPPASRTSVLDRKSVV